MEIKERHNSKDPYGTDHFKLSPKMYQVQWKGMHHRGQRPTLAIWNRRKKEEEIEKRVGGPGLMEGLSTGGKLIAGRNAE